MHQDAGRTICKSQIRNAERLPRQAPEALGLVRTSCDTSDGAFLYQQIAERFRRDPVALARERQAIGEWLAGRHPSYAAAQTVRWCQRD